MTPIELFERQLPDGLADLADARVPGYLDDILAESRRTRQRPRWTFFERWLPMSVISARSSTAPPLRAAWSLMLIGLLTAALVAGLLVIVGSVLLRDQRPDGLNAGLIVPTLELDTAWDVSTIPGLSQPSGLDVGPDGNLYVVNAGASEIVVLSPDGNVVRRWGERGAGEGQFYFQQDSQIPNSTIGGVAVAPDGSVYVADTVNDRVQQFEGDGTFIRQFGGFGSEDGRFLNPFDLAIDGDGNVLVADFVRDDIQRFTAEGTYLDTIGSHGTNDGQLGDTGGIAVDADGALYNADFGNDRLQSWSPDGTYRWSVGRDPTDSVALTVPGDVGVDREGFVYVTESGRMVVLAPDLTLASTWLVPDGTKAEEWLPIAVADDGTVYLSSEYNGVIYKLQSVERERLDVVAESPPAHASTEPAGVAAASAAPIVSGGLVVGQPFAVPFSADQPAQWKVVWLEAPGGVELAKERTNGYTLAAVRVFVPTNAYADPCLSEGPMSPPVGPTVDDLVEVLTNLPGIFVTKPVTDITIDGHAGKTFDLESTLISGDCPAGAQWAPMWTYQNGAIEAFAGPGDNFHQRIAILDVDGTRVLVETWTFDDTPLADVADTLHIVDSIDFS